MEPSKRKWGIQYSKFKYSYTPKKKGLRRLLLKSYFFEYKITDVIIRYYLVPNWAFFL